MIAIDTNVLVHAHREESPFHLTAKKAIETTARVAWALPWACLHEFLAIVTHPKIFAPPTPLADARATVRGWLETPTLKLLVETPGYQDTLDRLLDSSGVVGPKIHDARIAALCMHHAVEVLWTADRDFSRFPKLRTHNPLVS